jgi:ATP-dependent protease Clp ATPase subunit
LSDFYKLPTLQKSDQIDIIGELTQGSEVNMTPSKLVGVLDEFIISQKPAKMTISQAIRNKYRMRQITD